MAWKIEERDGRFVVIAADGADYGAYTVKAAAEAFVAIATKSASFGEITRRLSNWCETTYPPKKVDGYPIGYTWVQDVYADHFIYRQDEKNYRAPYALVGDELTVGEATEVRQEWEEVKSADTLVFQGGAVKALPNGKVAGYLVTFGDAENTDSSAYKDFFDATTDFDVELTAEIGSAKSAVYYHHGQDDKVGKRRLGKGKASLKADEVGVWVEAQLDMRDDYEKAIYSLAEAGKMGWSSGTAAHLVEREAIKRDGKTVAHHIKHWPLGLDASLTPTPAEMKCQAVALKSLTVTPLAELAEEADITISEGPPAFQGTFDEEAKAVASACNSFASRVDRRLDARVKSGRVLSAANMAALSEAHEEMSAVMGRISALLEKARPKQDPEPEAKAALEQARLQFSRLTHQTRDIAAL